MRLTKDLALRTALAGIAFASLTLACRGGGDADAEVPLPETSPFSAGIATQVHGIRDRVMMIRQLNVSVDDIAEGTLTRDQLSAYYDEVGKNVNDKDRRDLETFSKAMRLLRIIGPNDNLLDLFTQFGSEGTLGFYSIGDKKLVLIDDGSAIDREEESTLAHEYVHSFQGAAFDFDRFDKLAKDEDKHDDAPTEYNTTLDCLVEGDAELAQSLYDRFVLGPEPDDAASAPSAGNPPAADPYEGIPPGFLRYMLFNYRECQNFTTALFLGSGWDKINEAYRTPPSTTEQILHHEKYLARELPTKMAPVDLRDRLGKGWRHVDGGIFGEFDVYNYLVSITGDDDAARIAAAGWGVGWLNLYEGKAADGGESPLLAHVALEFDTGDDYAQFRDAYGVVINKLAGGAAKLAPDGPAVCWTGQLEHAYVAFDDRQRRVDILMATNENAVRDAAAGPLSSAARGTCPAWQS